MRRSTGPLLGGVLLATLGLGLGSVPAHAAEPSRCTVGSTTYRIAVPTAVRPNPSGACLQIVGGALVTARTLPPLLAARALVPTATPTPTTAAPVPAPATPGPGATPKPAPPTAPVTTSAPAPAPPASDTGPPKSGGAVPVPPVAGGDGAVAPGGPATGGPPREGAGTTVSADPTSVGGRGADLIGVDLLAPAGPRTDLDLLTGAPGVPRAPAVPEMVRLRNLGQGDPTGVDSSSVVQALAQVHESSMQTAALGAVFLAALAGLAVRHRLARGRRRAAGSDHRRGD